MSTIASVVGRLHNPFMLYGYFDHGSKSFRKYTRISSSVVIMNKKNLFIGDHVWVWHYSILDATEGLTIQEGCQIGAWVGIFTHGSEASIRLLGKEFVNIPHSERKGYTRGNVKIGAYTFIGANSLIMPGVNIGKGCLIGAGAMVNKNVPDYSVVVGSPGKVVSSTIEFDQKYFLDHDYSLTYYDQEALSSIKQLINGGSQ